jgi:hypothetical protein
MVLIIRDVQPLIVLSRTKWENIAYKIMMKEIRDMNKPAY